MQNEQFLKDLLKHRGPVFIVRGRISAGSDFQCPKCKGDGKCDEMFSDDAYSRWVEKVTCHTCAGLGRVSKTSEVFPDMRWSLTVDASGLKLSTNLKGTVYLRIEQANQEMERRNANLARELQNKSGDKKNKR